MKMQHTELPYDKANKYDITLKDRTYALLSFWFCGEKIIIKFLSVFARLQIELQILLQI